MRQSTAQQVRNHRESQQRQYALADRARQLGFSRIVVVVIDEDLGKSGSGLVERPGFGQLLAAICAGEAGAVLALEASRLARNNRDWHHLLDLCAMTNTVIIDNHGVYDHKQINDRLVLGLQGTMSEFELSMFRQRARQAIAPAAPICCPRCGGTRLARSDLFLPPDPSAGLPRTLPPIARSSTSVADTS